MDGIASETWSLPIQSRAAAPERTCGGLELARLRIPEIDRHSESSLGSRRGLPAIQAQGVITFIRPAPRRYPPAALMKRRTVSNKPTAILSRARPLVPLCHVKASRQFLRTQAAQRPALFNRVYPHDRDHNLADVVTAIACQQLSFNSSSPSRSPVTRDIHHLDCKVQARSPCAY